MDILSVGEILKKEIIKGEFIGEYLGEYEKMFKANGHALCSHPCCKSDDPW